MFVSCLSVLLFLGQLTWAIMRSFRFARWMNLGWSNDALNHVRMREIRHAPGPPPILQHAKNLTTVIVRMQCLMFYCLTNRTSFEIENSLYCKIKSHILLSLFLPLSYMN